MLAVVLLLGLASSARAAVPFKDIVSSGPLTHTSIGNELSCQVSYAGDARLELYPSSATPGDCGTFLLLAGTIYGFNYPSHDQTAIGGITSTPFTPVSQTDVTGAGTLASPFKVTTVVTAGTTGVQLTETDTYVTGQESYRTDVTIANGGGGPATGILWRAGDCYLQESDTGFGFVDPAHAAAGCALNANNSPAGRIEQWYPITGGASYMEDAFSAVWARIGSQQAFPNTCACTTSLDDGAGISWNFSVPPGGRATYSHYTTFSPRGVAGPPPATPSPAPGRPGRPPTSVTQPPGSCARRAPNVCIDAPSDIKRFGCVRIGNFVHRFGIKRKKTQAGRLINRVSRVTIVHFALDRGRNRADRKRPYYALVKGRRLRAGNHRLSADVRLKIPRYQVRRHPGRLKKLSYRRRLRFPFKTCPRGTG